MNMSCNPNSHYESLSKRILGVAVGFVVGAISIGYLASPAEVYPAGPTDNKDKALIIRNNAGSEEWFVKREDGHFVPVSSIASDKHFPIGVRSGLEAESNNPDSNQLR